MLTARGFNLVELLLVLAIVAVLAGIAVPRYADASARYRLESAARRLAVDLAAARAAARATASPRVVRFDAAAGSYEVDDGDPATPNEVVSLAGEPFGVDLVAVTLNAGGAVAFDAYGQADVAALVAVRAGGLGCVVSVEPGTGRASWRSEVGP